jgi:predicted phage terminase large subunit-like protein
VLDVQARWQEDDFTGRLLSDEHEGDPEDWEAISIPAVADSPDDVLGRDEGEPLYSPLVDETREQALDRWGDVKRAVGTYVFSAMYQQHPSSPKGVIFDTSWWRFWTMDENRATDDGRVVYLDPSSLTGGQWLDSWDCNFGDTEAKATKATKTTKAGSWVVGQRWVRNGPNRYLIAQQRKKWNFTETLTAMRRWDGPAGWPHNPCGNLVHRRLIEKKANGAAIITVLREEISGIKPINPTESKEARARSVTPEVESGHVYLPHPSDPGMEWVHDFLSEVRDFPNASADDQVDSMSQALSNLLIVGKGGITVPGQAGGGARAGVAEAAASDRNRSRR